MNINIIENSTPTNDVHSLDQYLRFMVFEEGSTSTVYARRSNTRFDDNGLYAKEYVAGKPGEANYYGEAEPFASDDVIATIRNTLAPTETRRYTYLFWLEGWDPEGGGAVPQNASLRIGATINAYPN